MATKVAKDKSNETVDASTSQRETASLEEKKNKLIKDIRELKALNFRIECSLDIPKFGNAKNIENIPKPLVITRQLNKNIPNVELEMQNELLRISGITCRKFTDNEYFFDFSSSSALENLYSVQVFNEDGNGKLGKSNMPVSVDVKSIVSEIPIDDLTNMREFLRSCKHHIDCYNDRVDQFQKLKAALNDANRYDLQANVEYTKIDLQLLGVKMIDPPEILDVILYLFYDTNEGRPNKIRVDSVNGKQLPGETIKKLNLFFKSFKVLDMEAAFEAIINSTRAAFSWKKDASDESSIDSNPSSTSELETDLSLLRRKRRRKSLKRQENKRKKKDNANKGDATRQGDRSGSKILSKSRSNERQKDLSDLSEREDDLTGENLNDTKRTKSPASPRKSPRETRKLVETGIKILPKKTLRAGNEPKKSKAINSATNVASKPTRTPKRNVKILSKSSKDNLKQTTLNFTAQNQKESSPIQPLSNKLRKAVMVEPRASKSSTNLQESNILPKKGVATSTPVVHNTQQTVRFSAENESDISTIELQGYSTQKRGKVGAQTDIDKAVTRTSMVIGSGKKDQRSSSESEGENMAKDIELLKDLEAVQKHEKAESNTAKKGNTKSAKPTARRGRKR